VSDVEYFCCELRSLEELLFSSSLDPALSFIVLLPGSSKIDLLVAGVGDSLLNL